MFILSKHQSVNYYIFEFLDFIFILVKHRNTQKCFKRISIYKKKVFRIIGLFTLTIKVFTIYKMDSVVWNIQYTYVIEFVSKVLRVLNMVNMQELAYHFVRKWCFFININYIEFIAFRLFDYDISVNLSFKAYGENVLYLWCFFYTVVRVFNKNF